MGLTYRRVGAVALTAILLLTIAGTGAVLAIDPQADDMVWDGVVRVHYVDRVDGVMAGSTIRIFYYRDGDPVPGILPGVTTNSRGVAVITGVPRAAEGTEPVFLDVSGRLSTATLDDEGCTTFENFIAQKNRVESRERFALLLQTTFRSDPVVNCPPVG